MMAESFTKLDGVAMSALLITRCNYSKSIVIKQHLTKHLICMACSCNLNELAKNKARIIDALKVPHTLLRSQPEVKTLNSHPPGLQWSSTATLAPPWQSHPIHTLGVLQVRKFSLEDLSNHNDNFHAKMVDQAVPAHLHPLHGHHKQGQQPAEPTIILSLGQTRQLHQAYKPTATHCFVFIIFFKLIPMVLFTCSCLAPTARLGRSALLRYIQVTLYIN